MTSQGLPRSWRIARGSDLQAVLKQGVRHRFPRFDITWCKNQEGHPRVGVVVPLYGRTAVSRNKVRRRIREYVRSKVLPKLSALDIVIWAKPAAHQSRWMEFAGDFDRWVQSFDA